MSRLTLGDWEVAKDISEWIEIAAIAVITVAVLVAFLRSLIVALGDAGDGPDADSAHTVFKQQIARGLLLGLDLLIAADIIRTVTLEPTLENVAALGLLVLVRTFLAWSLVLETENRWPWQRAPAGDAGGGT